MTPAQLIARKRDGEELSDHEIGELITQYTDGKLPDYQMSALAMAIYFRGMSTRETVTLTRALLESGTTLGWDDSVPRVDKHSTGGIGDKVSLVLAPIMACLGMQVPMLSGRGLGITGGTLDKLESFQGFRTDLTIRELKKQVSEIGVAITGASADLAPADRKLYALRDVTGTVPSRPLIVASILSKKLAEGLDSLVLDVKFGSGAFMKTQADARTLAKELVTVANELGVPTTALLTDMEQPLGRAIGNAVEVQEAVECLQGSGPADVLELSLRLGTELLLACGLATTEAAAHRIQLTTISDGRAFAKFEEMIVRQHGKIESLSVRAAQEILSPKDGFVHRIDAAQLGNMVIQLGGGRRIVEDRIDHSVGFVLLSKVGDTVKRGEPLLKVLAPGDYDKVLPATEILSAFEVRPATIEKRRLVVDRITQESEDDGF